MYYETRTSMYFYVRDNDQNYLGYLANCEASQGVTCNFGESGR
jgi:hypothetical protein